MSEISSKDFDERFKSGYGVDEEGGVNKRDYSELRIEVSGLLKKIERLQVVMQEKWVRELDWREGVEPNTLQTIQGELIKAAEALNGGKLNLRERERYQRGFDLMKRLIEEADDGLKFKDDVIKGNELLRRLQELAHAEYVLDQILLEAQQSSGDDTVPTLHPEALEELWKQVGKIQHKPQD